MDRPLLEIENLHVNFETPEGVAEVINGVDLSINEGETVALVGETGCGKSVTAKSILNLVPDAKIPKGKIRFKNEELLELSDSKIHALRGKEMGMIMQDPMTSLNPVFTVGEQLSDLLKYQGQSGIGILQYFRDRFQNDGDIKQKVIEMLGSVQLSAPERVFDSYPVELSGGMRQRVLIAMALLSEPDLLIADEPGTALDVTTESKILELLDELQSEGNTSMLYITHDLGVAKKVSDRIYVMYAGEIVEEAPTEKLFESPQHPYTRGLLDSIPQIAKGIGAGIGGELPEYTDPPKACRFAERCPFAEKECEKVYPYSRYVDENHSVACHLYKGEPKAERHQELAAERDVNIGTPPWETHGEPNDQTIEGD